jgi:NitT/TauT family transport system substrate-binding protein
MQEATQVVNKDKRAAGALWISDSKSKLSLDFVSSIVAGPQVRWTLVPENTMKFAHFMVINGMLREPPATWRDYFFPEIHSAAGS